MPTHSIHKKWAKKLGLCSLEEAGSGSLLDVFIWDVDSMIDNPQSPIDQFKSLEGWNKGLYRKMKHDCSRVDKEVLHLYLDLMKCKGNDYVKAFFLHHLLDILEGQHIVEGRKSLLTEEVNSGSFKGDFFKIVKRHELIKEYKEVESFVRGHRNEILRDLKYIS
jgi:hypothetical protein